jgi:hypothetical protein
MAILWRSGRRGSVRSSGIKAVVQSSGLEVISSIMYQRHHVNSHPLSTRYLINLLVYSPMINNMLPTSNESACTLFLTQARYLQVQAQGPKFRHSKMSSRTSHSPIKLHPRALSPVNRIQPINSISIQRSQHRIQWKIHKIALRKLLLRLLWRIKNMIDNSPHHSFQPNSKGVITISRSYPLQKANEHRQFLDGIRAGELERALPFSLVE